MTQSRTWIGGALIAAVVIAAIGGTAAGAPGWKAYVHPRLGFSLSFPSDWAVAGGSQAIAVVIVGPPPAGMQDFRMSVNVTAEPVPANLGVDTFEAVSEARIALLFQGYRRLRSDRTILGNIPAILRYFTWRRNDGVELYQIQLYTVAKRRGYVVTGTTSTQSAKLQEEAALLQQILATFRP